MENKLVSMTDFAISQWQIDLSVKNRQSIKNYAEFLKQPLTLGMFVPVDENENFLKEPTDYEYYISDNEQYFNGDEIECQNYADAMEKVLFEGWQFDIFLKSTNHKCIEHKALKISVNLMSGWLSEEQDRGMGYKSVDKVEDLVINNIILTKSALKQIYG